MRVLTLLFLVLGVSMSAHAQKYVGAQQCASCHTREYKDWQESDHQAAMALATETTVRADFNNTKLIHDGITSRFYRKGKEFWVNTDNALGKLQAFKISYTFGVYPLQQYMVDFPDGRKQVLNLAWDTRPKSQGGQRWFSLSPENPSLNHGQKNQQAIKAADPLHWTGSYYNWNSRCASCHSTHLLKNYDAKTNRYQTKWSEINVACEACHGPGARHIAWAHAADKHNYKNMGLEISLTNNAKWEYLGDKPPLSNIKRRVTPENTHQPEVCAQCHSRRGELSQWNPTTSYANYDLLRLIEPNLYYADGQMKDEVYVYGSFLQSKMHQNGVVCSDCHNPHSLKLKYLGNQTCLQCHRATVFDTPKHTHHSAHSKGSLCINCHMPTVTYMGVDARRDHSFRLPRPMLDQKVGSPDVCKSCHAGKSNQWAQKTIDSWKLTPPNPPDAQHFANAFYSADQGSAKDSQALRNIAANSGLAEIIRGSAALRLGDAPDQDAIQALAKLLNDSAWLVRLGAVRATQDLSINQKWQLLQPDLDEPTRAVRFEMARQLAGIPLDQVSQADAKKLTALFREFEQSLSFNTDVPETQVIAGVFHTQRGELDVAEQNYRAALKLAPTHEGALLNLADLYRATDRDDQGKPLLQLAVKTYPESAEAHYVLALWQVRHKDYQGALAPLQIARKLQPRNPTYTLTTALLLEQLPHRKSDAIKLLQTWQQKYGQQPQMQEVLRRLR